MKSKRAQEAAEVVDHPVEEVTDKKRKRDDGDADDSKKPAKKGKREKKEKKVKKKFQPKDEDAPTVKKAKREDKYKREKESRRERKDRMKDLQNLPGEADEEAEAEENALDETVNGNGVKKESKKDETVKEAKKEKKEKKDKKSKKEKKAAAAAEETTTINGTTAAAKTDAPSAENVAESSNDAIDLDASTGEKQNRHIVFVGNLPYTATAATISAHFSSLSPVAVRCLTKKGDDKPCRGIAFVEFGKVMDMRTCLDRFHHSTFDDGVSPARKINVELSAGGGGNAKGRQDKIKAKNQKLDENRAKRIEKEKVTKEAAASDIGDDSIHPSRRGRVPGSGY